MRSSSTSAARGSPDGSPAAASNTRHRGESLSHAVAVCAQEIGTRRAFYTTADTVADIEAIRVAGGYEKLVLYGTSYGTKVAEEYAQAYPGQVEALVLDSVVPPNGPDPLNRATFAAVPRILHQLCAARACAHITSHPAADVQRIVRRLERHALRAHWIDGFGHSHKVTISSQDLLEVLIAGDLEPTLRSEFPAAVSAALGGDGAPLARLIERAGESEEDEGTGEVESFDTPLYYATTCEETAFPWSRAAAPPERLALARSQIRALGANVLAPFSAANALDLSDLPACAGWPFPTPASPGEHCAPARRPHPDPERRRRPAHADRQCPRSRRRGARRASARRTRRRAFGARRRPLRMLDRRASGALRRGGDQALWAGSSRTARSADARAAGEPR